MKNDPFNHSYVYIYMYICIYIYMYMYVYVNPRLSVMISLMFQIIFLLS